MEKYNELVEEFFMAVECSKQGEPEIIHTTINIDLSEFNFTPQELEKLQKLLRKLNIALTDVFSEVLPAASILTELRSGTNDR